MLNGMRNKFFFLKSLYGDQFRDKFGHKGSDIGFHPGFYICVQLCCLYIIIFFPMETCLVAQLYLTDLRPPGL